MTGSVASVGDVGFSPEDGVWRSPGGAVLSVEISSGEAGPSKGWLVVSSPNVGCAL